MQQHQIRNGANRKLVWEWDYCVVTKEMGWNEVSVLDTLSEAWDRSVVAPG